MQPPSSVIINNLLYSFAKKFKSLFDQYDLRELHFYSLMRTKECEVQYNLARYEQQRKIAESEANRSRTLSAQVSTFSQTETELRSQLNIYVEKFKQVSTCSCCAAVYPASHLGVFRSYHYSNSL